MTRGLVCFLLAFACLPWMTTMAAVTGSEIEAVLSAHKIVAGSYQQEQHIAGINGPVRAAGEFVLVRNQGLLWRPLDPVGPDQLFVRNAQNSAAAQRVMSRIMLDVFSAGILSDKKFTHQLGGTEEAWHLLLTPKRRSLKRHLDQVTLVGGVYLEGATITLRGGRETQITFSDQEAHQALPSRFCSSLSEIVERDAKVDCESS